MKIVILRGYLTDNSAKKEALLAVLGDVLRVVHSAWEALLKIPVYTNSEPRIKCCHRCTLRFCNRRTNLRVDSYIPERFFNLSQCRWRRRSNYNAITFISSQVPEFCYRAYGPSKLRLRMTTLIRGLRRK